MTQLETPFGDRVVVFVRYPETFNANEILKQMGWAYESKRVYELSMEGVLIAAFCKEHYADSFRRENEKYIVEHEYDEQYSMFTVEDAIYDL